MNIVIAITLLLLQCSAILSKLYCQKTVKHVYSCIPCKISINNTINCKEVTQNIKIIHFRNSTDDIDYTSFVSSSIKIIEEPEKLTFYSCPPNATYFQVDPDNFYPIKKKLPLPLNDDEGSNSTKNTPFQTCLETYCLTINNNNKLKCHDNIFIGSLDFQLNSAVSLACIRNITYVSIRSRFLINIKSNQFFRNAHNVHYLALHLSDVKSFQCNSLQNLSNLRIVKISMFPTNPHSIEFSCLIQFNPNIVFVRQNDKIIWNKCTIETLSSSHRVFIISTVLILLILFLSIGILTTYIYKKAQVRILTDNTPGFNFEI